MIDFKDKMRSEDRILVLKTMPGKKAYNSAGLVDSRLFNGENTLHAIRTPLGIWIMKYDMGALPESLKQQFTSFDKLLKFAKAYFAKRNVDVVEVLD